MAAALHATDYLQDPAKHAAGPVCAMFGDEAFLKRQVLLRLREQVLGGGEGDFSFSSKEGPNSELRDVMDDLATIAMFGGGKRMIVVEEADDFVTRYRSELEDYVAKPKSSGVLVLQLKTFPANTRLYKAVAATGLLVDCSAPTPAKLTKWLTAWATQAHGAQLPGAAAEVMLDLVGAELGLIDQELAKLALLAGEDKKITAEMIREHVGSWRTKTAWDMLDAILDGDVRQAMHQLDRLLAAGENPIAILAQVSATLRRLAAATRLVIAADTAGRRISPRDALQQSGVKPFVLEKTERQLRKLGRQRGSQLYQWLVDADLDLKGASAMPPRTVLERLFLRLASSVATPKGH